MSYGSSTGMTGNALNYDFTQPLLFTDIELEKCDTRPKKPLKVMDLKTFDNPKNDNEILFNLQYRLIKNNDWAAFGEMWQITEKVAERIIVKILKGRKVWRDPEEIADMVQETCEYLLRRYKTRENYYITTNFIIAIKDSVRHALDYKADIKKSTVYLDDIDLLGEEIKWLK